MRYDLIKEADLAACADVFVEVFNASPWNEAWTISSAQTRLTEIYHTSGFLGIKAADSRIHGFAMGYLESFDSGADYYLKEMCVLPDVQRHGIGTAILAELESALVRRGARKLYLLTSRDSTAERFYAKNGFYKSEKMIMMGHWLKSKD